MGKLCVDKGTGPRLCWQWSVFTNCAFSPSIKKYIRGKALEEESSLNNPCSQYIHGKELTRTVIE